MLDGIHFGHVVSHVNVLLLYAFYYRNRCVETAVRIGTYLR